MAKDDYPPYPGGDYHPENDNSSGNPYGATNDPGYWSDDSGSDYGAPADPHGPAAGYPGYGTPADPHGPAAGYPGYGTPADPHGPAAGYPGYGAPNNPYGSAGYGGAMPFTAGGRRLVRGDGKVRTVESISYGFRTVFASPAAWIVGSLVVGVICTAVFTVGTFMTMSTMAASGAFDPETTTTSPSAAGGFNPLAMILFVLLMVAVQVTFAAAALRAADGAKITFGDFFSNPNLGKTIIFALIVNLVTGGIPYLIPMLYGSDTGIALMVQMLINLALLFLAPLYMLMYLFVLDQGASFGDAVNRGFQVGSRNYLSLLGFSLLWGLIIVVSAIPLGLGLLITMPAYMAALAYVFRQASGGIYPED
ncbi:hypothetical protein OS128_00100 [Corynebacterium sp. P5848]|uniref:hypothetical protein n=1 Tax=Corynebacterium marambiense TaxID=2765364 RepID=UPI002260C361|nr:hypothetical protein [Corynebacterium marambiense]MCX7541320.1 hypothetical protein [Corynebacterium marambiense]